MCTILYFHRIMFDSMKMCQYSDLPYVGCSIATRGQHQLLKIDIANFTTTKKYWSGHCWKEAYFEFGENYVDGETPYLDGSECC